MPSPMRASLVLLWTRVLKTDTEIFTRTAQICGKDVSTLTDGMYPLDKVVLDVMCEPRIQSLMFHLRAQDRTRQRSESSEIECLQKELKRLRQQPPSAQPAKGAGKGKGKKGAKGSTKGNKSGGGTRLPQQLIRLNKIIDGARLCFAFNLPEGCSQASPGKSCSRGVHKCMKCGGPHSASDPVYHQ